VKKPRNVEILSEIEDYSFDRLFRLVRAQLRHRRFDGRMSDPVTRINFDRGDSVGVLLFDPVERKVVLVRQFRYPVYASLVKQEIGHEDTGRAWLLEIVAGVREAEKTVEQVARRELLEEAGYRLTGKLEEIATVYPSPGGTSERITIFLGEVRRGERTAQGGGVAAEGEDIQVEVFPLEQALSMLERGEISDAKTVIALQHLALKLGVGGG